MTTEKMNVLNELAAIVHTNSVAHGFHDKPWEVWFPEQMMNIVGEVAELNDAHRSRTLFGPCDKFGKCKLTCIEEELADIIIRALDMFERMRAYRRRTELWATEVMDIAVGEAVRRKMEFNATRPHMHGKTS